MEEEEEEQEQEEEQEEEQQQQEEEEDDDDDDEEEEEGEEDEGLYYALADGEHAQCNWQEAAEKFAEGVITEETSIWCAGMADWATLAEARLDDAGSRINAALPTI